MKYDSSAEDFCTVHGHLITLCNKRGSVVSDRKDTEHLTEQAAECLYAPVWEFVGLLTAHVASLSGCSMQVKHDGVEQVLSNLEP